MIFLFLIALVLYALIGFNVIKLNNHRGNRLWAKIIFFVTLGNAVITYSLILMRIPESVCNAVFIVGLVPGVFYALKYFQVNLYKFQPASIIHIIYTWGALSLGFTLILELMSFGSNAKMAEWGFTGGLLVGVIMILILFLPKKKNNLQ